MGPDTCQARAQAPTHTHTHTHTLSHCLSVCLYINQAHKRGARVVYWFQRLSQSLWSLTIHADIWPTNYNNSNYMLLAHAHSRQLKHKLIQFFLFFFNNFQLRISVARLVNLSKSQALIKWKFKIRKYTYYMCNGQLVGVAGFCIIQLIYALKCLVFTWCVWLLPLARRL